MTSGMGARRAMFAYIFADLVISALMTVSLLALFWVIDRLVLPAAGALLAFAAYFLGLLAYDSLCYIAAGGKRE